MKLRLNIENKILLPFLALSMLSILCFGGILFYSGYNQKMNQNLTSANHLVRYVEEDINTLSQLADEETIVQKYRRLGQEALYLFDASGEPLLGEMRYADIPAENIIAESHHNALNWRVCYLVDQDEFLNSLLEDQKYIIIATIALLIITVQVSIFVAYNISEPIRRLSETCKEISEHPDHPSGKVEEYAGRHDEIGQLAD
ncbi:MAG: hypothetical protein RR075_02925, partial [Pygmaiobacter sp.]